MPLSSMSSSDAGSTPRILSNSLSSCLLLPRRIYFPTQKCVKIFPNTSSAKIWPRPVMLARSSKTSLRSSETKSPLRPDSREDRTRERFSWALSREWYCLAELTMMSCSVSSGMSAASKMACSSCSRLVPCLAEIRRRFEIGGLRFL